MAAKAPSIEDVMKYKCHEKGKNKFLMSQEMIFDYFQQGFIWLDFVCFFVYHVLMSPTIH